MRGLINPNGQREMNQFVENRVKEILEGLDPDGVVVTTQTTTEVCEDTPCTSEDLPF